MRFVWHLDVKIFTKTHGILDLNVFTKTHGILGLNVLTKTHNILDLNVLTKTHGIWALMFLQKHMAFGPYGLKEITWHIENFDSFFGDKKKNIFTVILKTLYI